MARISQEVSASFDGFVRDHAASLFGTAFLVCGDAGIAEDLVQETLVALLPKWDMVLRSRSSLAYARRAVINRFVDSRRGPRGRVHSAWDPPDVVVADDVADNVASYDAVMRLLMALPERQRAAVVLRFLYDWDDTSIAAAIGCRPSTVRSMVSRGLAALRTATRVAPAIATLEQPTAPEKRSRKRDHDRH